jgi:hypothetical protein
LFRRLKVLASSPASSLAAPSLTRSARLDPKFGVFRFIAQYDDRRAHDNLDCKQRLIASTGGLCGLVPAV